jgi:hypothetical protein
MKPFEAGKKGFRYNDDNPYREGTHNFKEWERGFNQAYYENIPRERSQAVYAKKEAKETHPSDF